MIDASLLTPWAIMGYFLIFLGLVGAVLPVVPGPLLIWLGAFVWAWSTDFQQIGWVMLTILGILALMTWGMDLILSTAISRKIGSSWQVIIGAVVGGIAGGLLLTLGIPVVGTLIGAFLGSVAGVWVVEMWIKRDWRAGRQAVRGYIGGSILSTILEVTLTLIMIGLFIWRVIA